MSKRTDTIRNLFAQPSAVVLSADNKEPPRRVESPLLPSGR